MISHKQSIQSLESRLDKIADNRTKDWWEKYLKNSIEFRGVNLVKIREELKKWYKSEHIEKLALNTQLDLALSFFAEKYAENKLAGVLFLQDHLSKKFDWKTLIPKFGELFQKNYIYDWNICDWFCVRVLGPMIKENGLPCAKAIAKWRTSRNVWQARASLVAFANLTKEREFTPLLLRSCSALIKRDERFAKTGVGWILRELSKSNKDIVMTFIEENKQHFLKESLKKSIKNFNSTEKTKFTYRALIKDQ